MASTATATATATMTTPPPDWDRLLSACQKNDPDQVRQLITEQGVSPSHANRMEQSALHVASLWAHTECVKALLELGANIHATNKMTGATPLHIAVQCSKGTLPERKLVIELLLDAGANPCMGDFYGSVPADYCNEEEILTLIAPGVPHVFEVTTVSEMERLLQQDETAVHARHRGMTPLIKVVDDLLECTGDDQTEEGTQLLELLLVLLKHGADPNATLTVQRNGHLMAQDDGPTEDPPLLKVLLKLKNSYRWHNAEIVTRFETAAKLLYEYGAKTEPSLCNQLLLDAARRNQVMFAEFLMNVLSLSPNVKGRQGMTPLEMAARSGQVEMVTCLLNKDSINVNATNDKGKTALDAARANDKQAVVELLEQYSAEKQQEKDGST